MRLLWMSDSPTMRSSYGNITRSVCAGLADRGYDVSILGWQTQGQPTPWQNCMLYPSNFSADEVLNYLHQLQPDVLVILADIWWLMHINCSAIIHSLYTSNIPWALYYTIDADMGENLLPVSWVSILKAVDLPIAMSRYAHNLTQANRVIPAYIPYGIDTKVFKPPIDKDIAKRILGYEGKFVILSDARNQLRKMLPRTLEIFRRFATDKDDVILQLHCDPSDPFAHSHEYSYDLQSDLAFLNLTEKVHLTQDMSISKDFSLEQLTQMYQAADVHLLTSWGEGFGVSTLQAAASGVVPLASDYAASPELVANHGETINTHCFLFDQFGLRRGLIDIDDAVSKLEKLYRDRKLLASKAQSACEFALSYDWEHIITQWDKLLQHEISRRKTTLNPPVEQERTIRIPVTLPLTKSKQRVFGCVYVASQRDVPTVLALHRIFPKLKVWSTIPLDFASSVSDSKPLQAKVVQPNSSQYRSNLAVSTLALDLGSFDPLLPIEAAKLGVPCIGLAQQRQQTQLWPELTLEKPDPLMATELGRQMLTDQGTAADLCLTARQRLASTVTPVKSEALESVRQ